MKNYSQTVTPNFDDVVQDTSVGSGGDGGWTMVTDSVGRGAPMINLLSSPKHPLYCIILMSDFVPSRPQDIAF